MGISFTLQKSETATDRWFVVYAGCHGLSEKGEIGFDTDCRQHAAAADFFGHMLSDSFCPTCDLFLYIAGRKQCCPHGLSWFG